MATTPTTQRDSAALGSQLSALSSPVAGRSRARVLWTLLLLWNVEQVINFSRFKEYIIEIWHDALAH